MKYWMFFVFLVVSLQLSARMSEICPPGYITPENGAPCSYQQKSRSTALTLQTFLGWAGAGDFYAGKQDFAITTTVISAVGFGLIWLSSFRERMPELVKAFVPISVFAGSVMIFTVWGFGIASYSAGDPVPRDGNGYALSNVGGYDLGVFFEDLVDFSEVPLDLVVRLGSQGLDLLGTTSERFCVLVDRAPVPIGEQILEGLGATCYASGQTQANLTLTPGIHQLTLQAVNVNGISCGLRLSQTLTVNAQ